MLTVLMATHNGTDTLGRTLESFCALTPPPGGWKLLVVNNASTDRTEELVLGFRHRLPLHYLVEPRLGKSHALNAGLEHTSGDLIIFADDDVLPDPDWLIEWRSAVDRYPEYAIFGGAIELLYQSKPPKWLSRTGTELVLFARTNPHPEGQIPATGDIFGPNMAIRMAALTGARFDSRFMIGPVGLIGDESDFVHRLAAQGCKCCFVPGARVQHIVHPAQLRWSWMLRRFYRFGKSQFVFAARKTKNQRAVEIFRAPRWLVSNVLKRAATAPFVLLGCNRPRTFRHLQRIAYDLGMIVQARASNWDGANLWVPPEEEVGSATNHSDALLASSAETFIGAISTTAPVVAREIIPT